MYTLRTITKEKVQSDTFLNEDYKICPHGHRIFEDLNNKLISEENRQFVKFWILYDNSTKKIPVFQQNENYIVMSNGQTLRKL